MKPTKMPILPAPVRGRICWLCEHVRFETGDAGYSEMTPGTDFDLCCGRDYWDFNQFEDGLTEFRDKLKSAEVCADFVKRPR